MTKKKIELKDIKAGTKYAAHHPELKENFVIIGVNAAGQFCTEGWPPTVGLFAHLENLVEGDALTAEEMGYRKMMFGENWL